MRHEMDERSLAETRLIDHLRRLPPTQRHDVLVQILRDRFAEVLGIEPHQIGAKANLLELGVDSLKAVELKIHLESDLDLALSGSLLFDYPNLHALSGFLLEQSGICPDQLTATESAADQHMATDLSEEDLARLLASEIEELNSTRAV